MRFSPTVIDGAWVIDLERMQDDRGSFARAFCADEFAAHGIETEFPQCNLSSNVAAGTLRGMHFNVPEHAEGKLVRCVRGAVHDVIVDLRRSSPSRLTWFGVELSAENGRALFVPAGCAHGFVTLADDADIFYHMTRPYVPAAARGFRWNDPAFAIEWSTQPVVMSDRDAGYADVDVDAIEG